ncbi:MAG: metallophosphoesterase family protein [Candidatus Hydrogenedentes bacterium]|nr:metallophosphoesterase family protein [Candidatus Hydrogenedentota bacterium]
MGVISDTHGLLRPEAVEALQGVELILHAGDAGDPDVLTELELIAPILAVRGNVDHGAWAEHLPLERRVRIQMATVYMRHILEEVTVRPGDGSVQVVITGHTHRPQIEERNGVLFLNPGSAGPRRFKLPVTLALLHVEQGVCRAELIDLERLASSEA